ncbi:MAG: hypothetical protein IT462_09000 [Planctomycetes bacterium]|nr:hypothetical protein [Planctomycetota bacterium]
MFPPKGDISDGHAAACLQKMTKTTDEGDTAMRERLNQALAGISHSEISRRTGFHVSNVNRYLRDARMPADFLARVTYAFGLNPVWALAGEGHARLDAVSQEVTRNAENLLSLVQAMRSVMRQRLGSLLGNRDKLLLSDLNDALASLEKARVELRKQAHPVMKDYLGRFQDALNKRDHKAAAAIEPALVELARLDDDDESRQILLHLRAGLAHMQGKLPESLDLELRAFLSFPTRVQRLDMPFCTGVHNLVLKLEAIGRSREALKVARAAHILLEGSSVPQVHVAKILGLEGMLQCGFFRLDKGLPLVLKAFARVEDAFRRDMMWAVRLQAEFLAGLTNFDGALALAPQQSTSSSMMLLAIAVLEDRRDAIKELMETRVGEGVGKLAPTSPWAIHSRALIGESLEPLRQAEEAALKLGAPPQLTRAAWAIRRAHVLAARGDGKGARRELDDADAARKAMPAHERMPWQLLLMYQRLRSHADLATPVQLKRAGKFFVRATNGGCRNLA